MSLDDTTNEIPYGYCHCGCGQKTNISPKNHTKRGYVKGEPFPFIAGHREQLEAYPSSAERFREKTTHGAFRDEIPYGYCHCGCGQKTGIAPKNHTGRGYVKGEPFLFIAGHFEQLEASRPLVERFWEKVTPGAPDECWLWPGVDKSQYGRIRSKKFSQRGVFQAHRLSWEIHFGPIPDGMIICHRCDTPACVNPAHLFLGTTADNIADMDAKGRHSLHKLTKQHVSEIRRRVANGETQAAVARAFGICQATVWKIARRKIWRHVFP